MRTSRHVHAFLILSGKDDSFHGVMFIPGRAVPLTTDAFRPGTRQYQRRPSLHRFGCIGRTAGGPESSAVVVHRTRPSIRPCLKSSTTRLKPLQSPFPREQVGMPDKRLIGSDKHLIDNIRITSVMRVTFQSGAGFIACG